MRRPRNDPSSLEVSDGSNSRRRLSLRQIEVFRAVMISGSVNGAAEILRVSQPSLSRVIRRTEDVLGFGLFERAKGRLVPTKEAGTLFGLVGRVYRQLDELGDAVERMTRGDEAVFRFGTTGSPGRCLVPRAIAGLHARLPQLTFHVDLLLIDQMIDYLLLQRGECIVSIFPIQHPLVRSEPLGESAIVCLVPHGHRLAEREVVGVDDLASEFLIMFESETPHGAVAEELFRAAGRSPQVGVRIRHIETAIGLVASGVGLALVDQVSVMDAATLPFSILRVADAPQLRVYLSWNRETARSRFLRELRGDLEASLDRPERTDMP